MGSGSRALASHGRRLVAGSGLRYLLIGLAICVVLIYFTLGDMGYSRVEQQEQLVGFVGRNGTRLFVDQAVEDFSRSRVTTMFQMANKMGLTVCRTWAFNDGAYHALQVSLGRFDERVFKVQILVYLSHHPFIHPTVTPLVFLCSSSSSHRRTDSALPPMGLLPLVVSLFMILSASLHLLVTSSDCPLDLSWSNFTLAASVCSDPSARGNCCRYISSFVAVSIARYANSTGKLGVPSAFSDMCISAVSETLRMYGVTPDATVFCGLGTKILVNYQCRGRTTVLEMLQSPNFIDVVDSCKMETLSIDSICKKCLNSGISYLHQLIGSDDNVTLSTCRNAVFVALAYQGDQNSSLYLATCFFGVQGLNIPSGSTSVLAPSQIQGSTMPSPVLAAPPPEHYFGVMIKEAHHHYRPTLVQSVGMGVTGLSVALLAVFVVLIRRKSNALKNVAKSVETTWEDYRPSARKSQDEIRFAGPQSAFKRFSYKELKKATGNFSSVIGKGGFGTVFRAQFDDNSLAAVKRMDRVSEQGEDDFCREMELLGRLHHRHLVSMRGFCIEKHGRFLVYEYMENGSLKDHLHSSGRTPLSWDARIQIAIDIANALEYLHFYCDPPLCHRDIKSSNILLDESFVAKVADFGLAHASRCGSVFFEPVNTHIRGTPGYMDPEYMITQELTEKSDIYSYGVLLLELVTGRRAIQGNKNLVEWSQKFMVSDSTLPDMVDHSIANSFDMEQLCVISWIIRWCTQREGRARPSIRQVLRMLHEKLDPVHSELTEVVDNDELRLKKGKFQCGEVIPYGPEGRCLMSSSSTSKSYCSRSFLLEGELPQSPPPNFSLRNP